MGNSGKATTRWPWVSTRKMTQCTICGVSRQTSSLQGRGPKLPFTARASSDHRPPIFSLEGGLGGLPLRVSFSPANPLAEIFHPPDPPIASQSISRDVPLARARAFRSSSTLVKGVAKAALYCAQYSHPPNPERAETRSCPRRAQFHRARSASKKGTWPLPMPSFRAHSRLSQGGGLD